MKTLMKLANSLNKDCAFRGFVIFEADVARATNIDCHAITHGPWNFDCATVVDSVQIKMALALNPKSPVWSGDTLNGVKLVSCYPAEDYPCLPTFDGAVRIECGKLADAVTRTLPAAADNDIRYYLNTLCFDHASGSVIGCDGHRLHIVSGAYSTALVGQSLVTRDAFDLVGAKNVLHLDFTATHYRLGYCGGYMIGKLCDGKYPDYSRVLPAASSRPHVVGFNGAQTTAVGSVVAMIKARKTKFGALAINPDGTVEAYDIKVPCFASWTMTQLDGKYDTGQWQYGINAAYLHSAMQCADHGTIAVDTVNDGLLITNGDFSAVVMPCRL